MCFPQHLKCWKKVRQSVGLFKRSLNWILSDNTAVVKNKKIKNSKGHWKYLWNRTLFLHQSVLMVYFTQHTHLNHLWRRLLTKVPLLKCCEPSNLTFLLKQLNSEFFISCLSCNYQVLQWDSFIFGAEVHWNTMNLKTVS